LWNAFDALLEVFITKVTLYIGDATPRELTIVEVEE
jgi:hypothetical protein